MAETKKKSWSAEGMRFYRNFNIVTTLGSLAVGALVPPIAPVMNVLAGINAVQAAGGEVGRRYFEKKKKSL